MAPNMFPGVARFADNIAKLRNATASFREQNHRETREIIDDVVVIGEENSDWDTDIRDGRLYMTRRD